MKTVSRLIALTIAGVLAFGCSPASQALSPASPADYTGVSENVSQQEIDQLANDFEVLFTEYIQQDEQGKLYVNVENLTAVGMADKAMELQFLADSLNSLPPASTLSQSHISPGGNLGVVRPGVGTAGVGEFAGCVVLEGLGIPAAQASPALLNAIKDGIRAWNWGLTAKTVARILGAGAVKALGGPVAIGVSLGWAAYSCRGKL